MQHLLSFRERDQVIEKMARDGIDVLVVGGGVTGSGVALEAASRGYSVGLIDKNDFASGTSSKSTKLVHGGIRYLPQFDFALVHEGLVERGLLARNAPHLVKPLGFVLPLYKENKRPMGTPIVPPFGIGMSLLMEAGLLLYDTMAGKLGIGRHKRISRDRIRELAPSLKQDGLTAAFIYYDGQTDDTLLTLSILRTAAERGAALANYVELQGFELQGGLIVAARVRDTVSGTTRLIRCKSVINAGGAFAGRIEEMAGKSTIVIRPAKGVHITVSRDALPISDHAVVLPETPDGRLLFLVPWNTRVTIGTTDTKGGDVDNPRADALDIQYLLETTNHYLDKKLSHADIISAWAGYRPLISASGAVGETKSLSRTHIVHDGPGGMVTITGGKLTSYRRMAQDTLDHLQRQRGQQVTHFTEHLALDGADDYIACAADITAAAHGFGWNEDVVRRLAQYGSESRKLLEWCLQDASLARQLASDLPYTFVEVRYACRHEMAVHLEDVMIRRLHVNFEDRSRGFASMQKIAELMAAELGWSPAETQMQIDRYRRLVEADATPLPPG